jgi:hypothetical protein
MTPAITPTIIRKRNSVGIAALVFRTEYPSRTGRQYDPKTRPVLYSQAASWMIRHGAVSMGNSAESFAYLPRFAAISSRLTVE